MKKLLLCILFMLVVSGDGWATDVSVLYKDTMISSDTDGTRIDSAYTAKLWLEYAQRLWLSVQVEADPSYGDSNFAADTFFVFLEHSPNGIDWTGLADTLLALVKGANDTIANISTRLDRDSIFVADWVRFRFEHHDSLTTVDIKNNVYAWKLTGWINLMK